MRMSQSSTASAPFLPFLRLFFAESAEAAELLDMMPTRRFSGFRSLRCSTKDGVMVKGVIVSRPRDGGRRRHFVTVTATPGLLVRGLYWPTCSYTHRCTMPFWCRNCSVVANLCVTLAALASG